MLGKQFIMCHDLLTRSTLLLRGAESEGVVLDKIAGIELAKADKEPDLGREALCLVATDPHEEGKVFDSLYSLFGGLNTKVFVSFAPARADEVLRAKHMVERLLSSKETGSTESTSTRGDASSQTAARHTDTYYDSDETEFLTGMLESLKNAALTNGSAYKTLVFLSGDCSDVNAYLCSKLSVLEHRTVHYRKLEELFSAAGRIGAPSLDSSHAARMLGFSNSLRVNSIVGASTGGFEGEITIGICMEGSTKTVSGTVATNSSAFNLGTLISGMPGTGKTLAAMHLLRQLLKNSRPKSIVISPTGEWNGFARENGMRIVYVNNPSERFNFFKIEGEIETTRFYENLAMLLASASDAGPYSGTLEKCLLSAFRRVYAKERDPDPVSVYEAIEEAIAEQHGKRSAAGVKYTKHGENARAALQNMRSMLNRPEFSKKGGANFTELLETGVVFDLSGVSNKMKQFYYALILNQVYGVTDGFDVQGDRSLRALICLEEAQVAFRAEKDSASAMDLIQRIQDFRKKGVGIMLITHNVTDMEPAIRRLCQTKLYFRQSADVARFAASDLLFGETEKDALIERLKSLEQRVFAVNSLQGRERAYATFATIPEYNMETAINAPEMSLDSTSDIGGMTVRVTNKEGITKRNIELQVFYVGEKVAEGVTDENGDFKVDGTIRGNAYVLAVLGERKKDSRRFAIIGGEVNIVIL